MRAKLEQSGREGFKISKLSSEEELKASLRSIEESNKRSWSTSSETNTVESGNKLIVVDKEGAVECVTQVDRQGDETNSAENHNSRFALDWVVTGIRIKPIEWFNEESPIEWSKRRDVVVILK
jgi:hypothetical protein